MENTELIYKAICYAKHHYSDTSMSVEMVADHAGFSMDYFNRIFLAHTGFTVMAYVNYMRDKKRWHYCVIQIKPCWKSP